MPRPDDKVHGQWVVHPDACNYSWTDGWGTHRCYLTPQHHEAERQRTLHHRCPCDATTRKTP